MSRQTNSNGSPTQGGQDVPSTTDMEDVKADAEPTKGKGAKDRPSSHLEVHKMIATQHDFLADTCLE